MNFSDWLIQYGSWSLAPFGLLGMYLAGQKKTWGWLVSMGTQSLWAVYAVGTGQYGFLIGTVSYFCVYLRNWLLWRKEADGLAPDIIGEHPEGDCSDQYCDHCNEAAADLAREEAAIRKGWL